MSASAALRAMEPLLLAAFGRSRARADHLDAVLCHDLMVTLVSGMRGDQFSTSFYGSTGLYVVSTTARWLGDGAHAGGVSYAAAAVVLVASRVEEGVWSLCETDAVEPWARANRGARRPLLPTAEPLRAAASVLLASGWAEVLKS